MKISSYNFDPKPVNGITIHSCGYNIISNGDGIHRPQGRSDYLLLFIFKGYEIFEFENGQQIAHAPSVILFRPHEAQVHYYDGTGTAKNYYVHFSVDSESIINKIKMKSSNIYKLSSDYGFNSIFEKIMSEMQSKYDMYIDIAVSYFEILLASISRKICEDDIEKNYTRLIHAAVKSMYHNYSENKTLSEYADMCHMSKYHFIRVFKKSTGITPIEYRNKIRINIAKDLLLDTDMNISRIAEYCGFSNPNYFCDAFRKSEGYSPSVYRSHTKNIHDS